VKALNDDMPFDQFSIKQLAGDMLPNATPEDIIATGFHRNTMLNEEGGIDPNEYRFYAMVDRVGVTGTAWMGLTLNCCQCHTHKYDPILHTDYYSVMALLNNADEPTYHIPTPDIEAQQKAHAAKIAKLEADLPKKFPGGEGAMQSRFAGWIEGESKRASNWQIIRPTAMKTTMPHLEQQPDGFILGSGDISKSDVYDLSFKAPIKGVTAIKLEVASHPSLPNDGPGLTNYEGPLGGFFLSELQAFQNGQRVKIARAEATNEEEEDKINDAATAAKPAKKAAAKPPRKRPTTPWPRSTRRCPAAGRCSAVTACKARRRVSFREAGRSHERLRFEDALRKALRLPARPFPPLRDHQRSRHGHRASVGSRERTRHQKSIKRSARPDARVPRNRARDEASRRALACCASSDATRSAHARMKERPASNPRPTNRYHRGEYLQPKETVPPAVPAFLPSLPKNAPANRLTFAKWLFAPENPLTARVTVNRQWQAFFGRGLVKSLGGLWLSKRAALASRAARLARRGVCEARLEPEEAAQAHRHQRRPTSRAAASRPNSQKTAIPKTSCSLAAAFPPRCRNHPRLRVESRGRACRLKMGGPGVYPPQPASVTSEGTYGKFEWKTSEGEDRYRRSLYTFIKRTAPFAMSTTFDAPTGEACLARRDVSNSPLQALTLLNDQMFMEAAQAMAKAVIAESQDDDSRLQNIFRRCTHPPAAADELAMLKTFLQKQRDQKLEGEALWTSVCRAVLNLDEAITHPLNLDESITHP
jgi:hypothetical protein